jgi:hypothetical protein
MHRVLNPYMEKFGVLYFEKILIYSHSWQTYLEHTSSIFETLQNESFFLTTSVNFLGFFVYFYGVYEDKLKVVVILEWPTPKRIHDVRSFHWLASLY